MGLIKEIMALTGTTTNLFVNFTERDVPIPNILLDNLLVSGLLILVAAIGGKHVRNDESAESRLSYPVLPT